MGIVSYAQNFEDVMLWRVLRSVERGFYIDIGAQDPCVDSVSKAFYDRGWRGVHVEPTAEFSTLLRAARPDERVIQAVVSDKRGMICFFESPGGGLSTGVESIARDHEQRGIAIRKVFVPQITLDDVLETAGTRHVHWMKIDVEGMERQVLLGWKRDDVRPWVVVVESTVPCSQQENWREWESLILEKGYQFAYFDGLNRFYVSSEHAGLMSAFRVPPNVFDEFALAGSSTSTACNHVSAKYEAGQAELRQANDLLRQEIDLIDDQQKLVVAEYEFLLSEVAKQFNAERNQAKRHLEDLEQTRRVEQEHHSRFRRELTESFQKTLDEQLRVHADVLAKQEEAFEARVGLLRLEMSKAIRDESDKNVRNEIALRKQLEAVRLEAKEYLLEVVQKSQSLAAELHAQHEIRHALGQRLVKTEKQLLSAIALEAQFHDDLRHANRELAIVGGEYQWVKDSLVWRLVLPLRWIESLLRRSAQRDDTTDSRSKQSDNNLSLGQHSISASYTAPVDDRGPLSAHMVMELALETNMVAQYRESKNMKSVSHVNKLLQLKEDEFLPTTYWTLLGRKPDPVGVKYYSDRLKAGASRASIVAQIANSKEAVKREGVRVAGLDALLSEESSKKHWFRSWLKWPSRAERQFNQIERAISNLESSIEIRFDLLERKLDGIKAQAFGQSRLPIDANLQGQASKENHSGGKSALEPGETDGAKRSSIIRNFSLEKVRGPDGIIAEIEKNVLLSSEAASFAAEYRNRG